LVPLQSAVAVLLGPVAMSLFAAPHAAASSSSKTRTIPFSETRLFMTVSVTVPHSRSVGPPYPIVKERSPAQRRRFEQSPLLASMSLSHEYRVE
jgi:hypothetical protein